MFRYMAFVWEPSNPSQSDAVQLLTRRLRSTSSDWQDVLDCDGLRVLCASSRPGSIEPYLLDGNRGVVLGTLFERSRPEPEETGPRKTKLGLTESAAIVSSGGRELIKSYWGRYVAFVVDAPRQRKWVVHDPTSNLPCLQTTFRGVAIYFSCIADCVRLSLVGFTVDWGFVRDRLALGPSLLGGTGLNEVSEVHRGECIEITQHRVHRSFYWHPSSIARSDVLEDPRVAAEQLRLTMKACARAWASCYESILHRLSGGLDSSVVLGCLASASNRPRITCVTYYIPEGLSDERPWARLSARHAGCDHIEHARHFNIDLRKMLESEPAVYPRDLVPYIEVAPVERQLAHERKATAVFNGIGGDALFGNHSRNFIADDYVSRHGFRSRLMTVAADTAFVTNTSVWSVLARVVRSRISKRQFSVIREAVMRGRQLVAPSVMATLQRPPVHAWFRGMDDVPWGLVTQLGTLIESPTFYNPLRPPEAPDPESVEFLNSQPIVELCLRIPLYIHSAGGRDRALVRRAFVNDVPNEILNRQWKDRAPGHFERMLQGNREFARELLLGGILVKEGLLDRKKLEGSLVGLQSKSSTFTHEMLDHLYLEAWLRQWIDARDQAAA